MNGKNIKASNFINVLLNNVYRFSYINLQGVLALSICTVMVLHIFISKYIPINLESLIYG